jgi:hypothetical protein
VSAMVLNAYQVKILNIHGDSVSFDKYVKKGVNGYVLCPYNGKNIICARVVADGKKGKLAVYDDLKNEAFALPVVLPKAGDSVILAKNYDRVLIIAPDQREYLSVKESYKKDTVISADNFASFLDDLPTKEDFIKFAKKMDIGKIVFVLDKIYEVDANTFYVVKKYGSNSVKYKEMFFTTYPKFDIKDKNVTAYYKSLIKE